jgi:hypothetical protein
MNKVFENFGVMPESLLSRLRVAQRVILIANNPAIGKPDMDSLQVGPMDVVITFNTCIKSDLLGAGWVKVIVHGFNEPDRYFFGLPCRPEVESVMSFEEGAGFTILMGCTGHMSPLPGVGLVWARFPLPVIKNYPSYRPDGKLYAGPSTGFSTLVFLDWLRKTEGACYEIVTLGFSNEAGKLWRGHAWDYEREWLRASDVISVGLKYRPWWSRIFR